MSKSSNLSFGCLLAFATPFALVGIYCAFLAIALAIRGATREALFAGGMALAFGGSGFFLIIGGFRGKKRAGRDDQLRALHPEEPWLWNEEWQSRRIRDKSPSSALALWGFALFWNAVAVPILLFMQDELRSHRFGWVALLFPLAGIGLLVSAVRATLQTVRFRQSTLILDTLPAPIGGVLRGSVEVPHALDNATAVMLRLVAVEWRRSGKSTEEFTVSHEEREIDPAMLRRTGIGAVIPIEIAVPADAPPSVLSMGNEKRTWRLVVDAEVPGVDYSATFEVPVFQTALSGFPPHSIAAPVVAPLNPRSFVERSGPRGHEIHFPPFRAVPMALGALLFSMFWFGAVAFMVAIDVPRIIPIFFGLAAIPIVLLSLELLFVSRTIIIAPAGVVIRRRFLFAWERTIPRHDVAGARATLATHSGARPYYHVDVQTKSGTRRRAAKYIRSKREAEWVASRITKA